MRLKTTHKGQAKLARRKRVERGGSLSDEKPDTMRDAEDRKSGGRVGGEMVKGRLDKRARGGKTKKRAAGGNITNNREDDGDWTDNLDRVRPVTGNTDNSSEKTPPATRDRIGVYTPDVYQGPDKEDKDQSLKRGGALTTKSRNALPTSDFALSGRKYPIENPSHARNALARVSQHGSSAEKATVRRAVKNRYPNIGQA